MAACRSGQHYRDQTTRLRAGRDVREQWLDDRPKLVTIDRSGDGAAAIAFAAKSGEPPIANYGLSLIIQRRLEEAGIRSEANPSSFGLSFVTLASTSEQAAAAITALRNSIASQIKRTDFDRQFLDKITEQFDPGAPDAPGDIEIARCSGQLYRDAHQSAALADGATLVRWLELARTQAFSQNQATFAVVGPARVAAAVRSRLLTLAPWPTFEGAPFAVPQHQPEQTLNVSISNEWAVSTAWVSGSFSSAVSAWRALRAPDSPLLAQLSALDSPWRIDGISAIAAPIGGCLRIDVSDPESPSTKTPSEAAQLARVLQSESRIALMQGRIDDSFDIPELFGSDPRLTARRAAWRSLTFEQPDSQSYVQVSVHAPGNHESVEKSIRRSLAQRSPPIETRSKVESGQPEQWMLLASPCAGAAESSQDSGATATWLQALAHKYSGNQNVWFEPWISEDGLGIFAHIRPTASANPEDSSQVLGDALGRVVATAKVTGQDLAFTREEVLIRVGAQPRRAWSGLLDTISGHRPSLFDVMGTADSIRHLNPHDLVLSRRRWMHGPLRLAFTMSAASAKSGASTSAVARWLDPHRAREDACVPAAGWQALDRETQIVTFSPDELDATAYIAFNLQKAAGATRYDRWLEWLLNRPGGWLEQMVVNPGFARAVSSHIRGARGSRVLFLEINSVDDAATSEAVKRIRILLAELADKGGGERDVELASRWDHERTIKAALEPRNRLVQLWLGDSPTQQPSRAGFSLYLATTLGSAPVTIMRVRK